MGKGPSRVDIYLGGQEIPFSFYETQMLMTMFTRAHTWLLSWTNYIQATDSHPTF
jgi:hypothetical protein